MDRGKSNLTTNFTDFMRNVSINLGIKLKGKSNLPCMDEEILDAMNGGSMHEERPMKVVD